MNRNEGAPDGPAVRDPFVELPEQQALLARLDEVYAKKVAFGVLSGPAGSGRRRLLSAFASRLRPHTAAAIIDGSDTDPASLLSSTLAQFGYDFSSPVINEMLGMLRVFALHQTDAGSRPFIGILNAEKLIGPARNVITALAEFETRTGSALSIVFSGSSALDEWLADAVTQTAVTQHLAGRFPLTPMTRSGLVTYLADKFGLALEDRAVARQLHEVTGGLPGPVDIIVHNAARGGTGLSTASIAGALAKNDPMAVDEFTTESDTENLEPQLLVSLSGQLVQRVDLTKPRTLIGRADHNDILLDSRYISRHHAIVVRGTDGCNWLVDLNSRNGTFVNSRAINCIALRHNDIIAMGEHRLKFDAPSAIGPRPDESEFAIGSTDVLPAAARRR